MRVALITPVLPHPRAGMYRSIERIVEEEIKGLTSRGHDVHVFTSFWNGGEKKDAFLGAPVTRVADTASRVGRAGRLFDLDYLSFGRAAVSAILSSKERFDIAHSLGRVAGAKRLRKAGIPTSQHFHHKDRVSRPRELLRIPFENLASGMSYRRASVVTASSAHGCRVVQDAWGVPASRTRVVYPGVDAPAQVRPKTGPRRRVLFVGTFTQRKRPDLVLSAARHLPKDVEFHFIGEGPMRKQLVHQAEAMGISERVHLAPPTRIDAQLSDALFDADVVVAPSEEEGFGMLVAEAMAHGRPVVVSDIPALREVVGEAGILFPMWDPAALARALERVLDDPGFAQKLGDDGRARVRSRFTWEKHNEALVAAWADARA